MNTFLPELYIIFSSVNFYYVYSYSVSIETSLFIPMRSPQVSKHSMIITSCYRNPLAVFRAEAAAGQGIWLSSCRSEEQLVDLPPRSPSSPSPGLTTTTAPPFSHHMPSSSKKS